MKKSDRIKRMVAFYFSITLFLILLPIILSYSLGYHIDFNAFKIYKTGLIYISSHPSGALIYVNGKLHQDLTPAQIEELKPGTYRITVKREGFYPWEGDLVVRPNMVTKADRIVLFPIAKEMKSIIEHEVSNFAISDKKNVYYMTTTGLFRSNIDGSSLRKLAPYSNWPKKIISKRFSPDGEKFLYFTEKNIFVVYLHLDKPLAKDGESAKVEDLFATQDGLVDVFWYFDSNYIIVVTPKEVSVVELRGGDMRNIVSLYRFNAPPEGLYYNEGNNSLYFTDVKGGPDLKDTRLFYRLDLRQKFFDKFMQLLLKKEPGAEHEAR